MVRTNVEKVILVDQTLLKPKTERTERMERTEIVSTPVTLMLKCAGKAICVSVPLTALLAVFLEAETGCSVCTARTGHWAGVARLKKKRRMERKKRTKVMVTICSSQWAPGGVVAQS